MGGLWYVVIVFFGLFFLRVPIAVVLISSTIVGLWFAPTPIPLSTVPTTLWQGVNHFVLMAIPFFILMGDLALASFFNDPPATVIYALSLHDAHQRRAVLELSELDAD